MSANGSRAKGRCRLPSVTRSIRFYCADRRSRPPQAGEYLLTVPSRPKNRGSAHVVLNTHLIRRDAERAVFGLLVRRVERTAAIEQMGAAWQIRWFSPNSVRLVDSAERVA